MARIANFAWSADDELARRAIEGCGALLDAWDELQGTTSLSRTMEEWLSASEVELLDGPDILGFEIDPEDYN